MALPGNIGIILRYWHDLEILTLPEVIGTLPRDADIANIEMLKLPRGININCRLPSYTIALTEEKPIE